MLIQEKKKRHVVQKREELSNDGNGYVNVQHSDVIYMTDSKEAINLIYPKLMLDVTKSKPFNELPSIFWDLYIARVHDKEKALKHSAPKLIPESKGKELTMLFEKMNLVKKKARGSVHCSLAHNFEKMRC